MAEVRLIKVFVACPGDVSSERDTVGQIFETLNKTLGEREHVRFESVNWKSNSFPSFGDDPQALLNLQIAEMSKYDLFVGIMWNKFGTPTPRAGSGTEEEFNLAVKSFEQNGKPHIMFYFNQAPSNFESSEALSQKSEVLLFKKNLQTKALTANYDGTDNFEKVFRTHVEQWFAQANPDRFDPPNVPDSPKVGKTAIDQENRVISDSGMWVLLNHSFFLTEEVTEQGDGIVSLRIPITNAVEDTEIRSLPTNGIYGKHVAFAYQNIGTIAKVISAERTAVDNKSTWLIHLKLDEINRGFGSELAMANLSVDKIAEKRARILLLNESPIRQDIKNDLDDMMLLTLVGDHRAILPDFWQAVGDNRGEFLPLARLWSVFHLLSSNVCQYILDLSIGPMVGEVVDVYFRGKRYKTYSNVEATVIEVKGKCDLRITTAE